MEVFLRPDESGEDLINRFCKLVNSSGLVSEMKRRESYEKPSCERRKKKLNKMRKSRDTRQDRRSNAVYQSE